MVLRAYWLRPLLAIVLGLTAVAQPLQAANRTLTETISAIKTKYNGNIVSAKTGDTGSRETQSGIWMRIYRGDDWLYELAAPTRLNTTEQW